MKKILITGGTGFIGSNLAKQLVAKGHRVTVLDNLSEQIHGAQPELTSELYTSVKDIVEFIKGTVTSRTDWEKAINDNDVIVHLAAETGTGQSMYKIEKYTDINVQGTSILLDILTNKNHSVSKVVVASSRAVYGEGKYLSAEYGAVYPHHRTDADMKRGDFAVKYKDSSALQLIATDENSTLHPSSVYGITKLVQEQLVKNVCASLGIASVAFRYQNVYGPGQSLQNPYTGILSIFSNRIKCGQHINIFEDGLESRDFVFIDDVVKATMLGIESSKADNEIFNVGCGAPVSVMNVAKMLVEMYGIDVPLNISGNYRLGDIRHNYADCTKIENMLGFKPKVDFKSGIKKFTDWVNSQQIIAGNYEKSLAELRDKGLLK